MGFFVLKRHGVFSITVFSITVTRVVAFACLLVLAGSFAALSAQESAGSVRGTVVDQSGKGIHGAAIAIRGRDRDNPVVVSDEGQFTISGLPAGTYSLQASAAGFAVLERQVTVTAGNATEISLSLELASVSEEVTVESEADTSVASQMAPMKALLDAESPRTEISSQYVRQYTTPTTDFADILQAAPGVVTWAANGVGNGDSKVRFRAFADGAFTTTWDGVPWQDSNDPTHHSWAYVPAPAIGYVDFDRSPGTASDVGPTNFGGSVHMFSPKMGDDMSFRLSESYGSFNTNQILGVFDSGLFLNKKANFWLEAHHNNSDGYLTYDYQQRTAATAKFNYKFSDKTYLTLIGTVIVVDSNTPDADPTRQQILDHGINYIADGNNFNKDGTWNSQYYKNFRYHVPTDFEIITFGHEFGGWRFETKPYSYSYSNHQHLMNDQTQDSLHEVAVGTASWRDKLNQYNRGGIITTLSQASKYGVFRVGAWYEYTTTDRFQQNADPRTGIDSPLLKDLRFHEHFITNSAQPYIEYQFVGIRRWTFTAGVKSALYTMDLTQFADNGKAVGNLGCTSTLIAGCAGIAARHSAYYNNILPSFAANYRITNIWSAYGQYGRGSQIPPSAIFDVTGAQVAVTPKPTVATTFQGGTVVKLNHLSFDADVYHVHFDNNYSSYKVTDPTSPNFNDSYYYATAPTNGTGFEAEGNWYVGHGLSFNFTGTAGQFKYAPMAAQSLGNGNVLAATLSQWVAGQPNYTVSAGVTYTDQRWAIGFFNKDVGSRYVDNGTVHQATQLNSFWMNNFYINYKLPTNSFFNGSKVKLSFNNLFDFHDVVALSPGVSATAAVPYVQSGADTLQLLPGRSVTITLEAAMTPRRR